MKLLANIVPQACFSSPQACFWRGLGASWASLGRNLDALGELLGSLGCLFAASWAPFGCFLGALGRIWALIGASALDFGGSWAPPGCVLELWGSFRYDFRRRCANCCREPSMAFTLAFRSPLAARRYVRSTWNASKNEVPKNIEFCEVFNHSFSICVIFETLKISIFPREN